MSWASRLDRQNSGWGLGTLVALALVLGPLSHSSSAQTKQKFDPEKIRREMEQKRREMEQKRREMQRNRVGTSSLRTRPTSTRFQSSNLRPSISKSASTPRYEFRPNQRLGYVVLLEWKSGGTVNRITGMPFYQVKYQHGSKSTMLAIGKFRHYVKTASDDDYRHLKSRDCWMPTIQIVGNRYVEGSGNEGMGELHLPYLMSEFVTISNLMFPPLPTVLDRKLGKEEPAVISRTANGPTLWEGFTSNGKAGRVARYTEGKSLGSSTKLEIDHSYTNEAEKFLASYKSKATIDRQGLRSSQGTYTLKEGERTTIVAIAVRRLTGSELESAQQSAIAELGNLPKSLLPVELARKPLDLHLPKSYSADSLPQPGTKVAYYDRTLNQRFEAVYLQKYSNREVQIQLSGSNERQTVRPSALSMIKN